MPEETVGKFYLDPDSLELIVEALLTKIKDNMISAAVTSGNTDETVWATLLQGLTKGVLGETDLASKAVSLELLAAIIAKGKFVSYEGVIGKTIEETVTTPVDGTIYLLKDPDTTGTNVTMWMHMAIGGVVDWFSLGSVDLPEIHYVDTDSPDSVKNIVSHINRGETDYSGSANVQPGEIVTAQVLTNVLVQLGYGKKKMIPFSEGQGKPISEVVGKPDVNTFYCYQQTADNNDWAVYTAAAIVTTTPGEGEGVEPVTTTSYVWLKISGAEGGAAVEVDLSNYWTKDELKPLTAEVINTAVNNAFERVENPSPI